MNAPQIVDNILKGINPAAIRVIFADCRNWADGEHIHEHLHKDLYQIDLFHGAGDVTLSTRRVRLHRWGLTFIPPTVPHSFTAANGGRFRNIGIKARIDCPELLNVPAFCIAAGASHRLEQIQRDLQSILQEWQLRSVASQQLMQTRSMSLILESLRLWLESEDEIPSHGIVQDACQYMALRYSQPLTVAQLARHCGVRPESLSRAFRRALGISPGKYLSNLRTRQARALLEAGVSVTETARQTGFTSIHYFSRAFKKGMKVSPRQWTVEAHRSS